MTITFLIHWIKTYHLQKAYIRILTPKWFSFPSGYDNTPHTTHHTQHTMHYREICVVLKLLLGEQLQL